jgi:DNA-binding response OmpR family regulator
MSGAVDCLLKPFTPEDLARRVREALDQPRPAAERKATA